ncbi:hypothetical protein HPP92_005400 [Vanilla planifolia]|uniref:Uncharacterized protein n=1 Tax=Vanilla planifolia TaxID=51239 RepID=A0A835RUC9_VANPL|nr:hypothetical protein HPP92_005400 [Vanilla planifolia]
MKEAKVEDKVIEIATLKARNIPPERVERRISPKTLLYQNHQLNSRVEKLKKIRATGWGCNQQRISRAEERTHVRPDCGERALVAGVCFWLDAIQQSAILHSSVGVTTYGILRHLCSGGV